MYFLYCVWAYNRNYRRIYSSDHETGEMSEESDEDKNEDLE